MNRLEVTLTTLLVIAAVIVAAAVAKREFTSASGASTAMSNREIGAEDWERLMALGHQVGDPRGRVKVVVMADFECPACKRFHEGLIAALSVDSAGLDVRYVHLPLSYHRFALPSARLFECAVGEDAVASRLATLFFERQDSLGLLPWSEFAARAGASDPRAMARCASDSDSSKFYRIAQGIELGRQIGVPGTPAVIVNAVLQAVPPSATELLELPSKQ